MSSICPDYTAAARRIADAGEQTEPWRGKFPPWLKVNVPGKADRTVNHCLHELNLGTVCQGARCPNQLECYQKRRATFLLMGPNCTRHCRFCGIGREAPAPLDADEPARVAEAVKRLGLRHAVITSVTRDDLPDGGAEHFANTVEAVRATMPQTTIEILVPDFQGDTAAWDVSAACLPDVYNHNIETVPRLYSTVRPDALYTRSVELLAYIKKTHPRMATKSGMMLGLGETMDEVLIAAHDLREAGVDMLTIGQYLCPEASKNLPVERFVPPAEFDVLREELLAMGFGFVAAGPFVRSSYNAEEALDALGVRRK